MKTVKDFKDAGGVLTVGDKLKPSLNPDWHSSDDDILESFAWRTNTGVKPVFVGRIECELRNSVVTILSSAKCDWTINENKLASDDITKWRPHLPKFEYKPKTPYDVDAHVSGKARCVQVDIKPVFTQAMADAGELPMAGVTCEYKSDSGWRECFIVGMDQGNYLPVIQSYGALFFMPEDGLEFRPIQTEREKAIDKAFLKMYEGVLAPYNQEMIKNVLGAAFDAGLIKC